MTYVKKWYKTVFKNKRHHCVPATDEPKFLGWDFFGRRIYLFIHFSDSTYFKAKYNGEYLCKWSGNYLIRI